MEVLSETTERRDRSEKWLAYRSIPTLTDYVMIASAKHELEHYKRLPDASPQTSRRLHDFGRRAARLTISIIWRR